MTRLLLALLALLLPASAHAEWAEVNGVSLRYAVEGRGPDTVVLLHEMGLTLEGWDAIVPGLARRYRVLRYDLRGFGLSEKLAGAVSIEQEVGDLAALLDRLAIRTPVVLVGGAVGGAVALRFAADHPERVRGLVALSPAAGVAPEARAAVLAQAAAIERGGMRRLLGDMEDIYPSAIRRDPAQIARFRAIQLSTDPASMAATLRMIATTDYADVLPRVRAPALVVAAALYPQRSEASLRVLAAAMPRGRFATMPTGHFVALQSPELLQPLLDRFLADLPETAP